MSRFRFIPREWPKMSREAMYDVILSPVITEKATMA